MGPLILSPNTPPAVARMVHALGQVCPHHEVGSPICVSAHHSDHRRSAAWFRIPQAPAMCNYENLNGPFYGPGSHGPPRSTDDRLLITGHVGMASVD